LPETLTRSIREKGREVITGHQVAKFRGSEGILLDTLPAKTECPHPRLMREQQLGQRLLPCALRSNRYAAISRGYRLRWSRLLCDVVHWRPVVAFHERIPGTVHLSLLEAGARYISGRKETISELPPEFLLYMVRSWTRTFRSRHYRCDSSHLIAQAASDCLTSKCQLSVC
jgi:hypothetical protein